MWFGCHAQSGMPTPHDILYFAFDVLHLFLRIPKILKYGVCTNEHFYFK